MNKKLLLITISLLAVLVFASIAFAVDLKDFKGVIGPLNIGTNFNLSYEFRYNRISVFPTYKFSDFFLPELNLNTYTFSQRHSYLISLGYTLK